MLCRATDRQHVISSSLRHPCPVGSVGERGSRIGAEKNVPWTTRPPLSQYIPLSPPPPLLFVSAIPYPLEDFCRHVLFRTFPQEYFNNGCLHLSDWLVWLCSSLVPRRSRLGQSWTLPWAVTSPRDTSRGQRGKRERLGTRLTLQHYLLFSQVQVSD